MRRGTRGSAGEASVILVGVTSDPPTERAAGRDATPADGAIDRRTAAIAGHRADEAAARRALGGGDDKAVASALGALARMGAVTADDLTGALAADAPGVRRRAAELSASAWAGDGELDDRLLLALLDEDPLVVEAACFALGERRGKMDPRRGHGVVGAVGELIAGHPQPHVREAAVAALGAMGDAEGLPAVLAALGDRPTVRRRAAVALAAFDGDEAEAALRRCLQDRDWQVRQVAETLLDLPPT
jgi:HEAT repeat protein